MRRVNKLLVGAPGIGKTASVRAQYDFIEVLLLSSCTEDDVAGLPYLDAGRERRTKPHWLERLLEAQAAGGRGCLFLDELDKARREVADTLLTLVTHPHTYGIADTVDIVAAANPPEWGGGDGISKPMLSRFAVIPFVPDMKFLCSYLRGRFPTEEAFLRLLECGEIPVFDSVGDGLEARVTCPRTIEMALVARAAGEDDEVICGLLTANVANALLTHPKDVMCVAMQSRNIGNMRMPVSI